MIYGAFRADFGRRQHSLAFIAALGVILAWAVSESFLGVSDIWQLSIDPGPTIVTFLMVFVLQNSQNRTSKAIHLKLDELTVAIETARNTVLAAKQESGEALDRDIEAELDCGRDQPSAERP